MHMDEDLMQSNGDYCMQILQTWHGVHKCSWMQMVIYM